MNRRTMLALPLLLAVLPAGLRGADPRKAEEKALIALDQVAGIDVRWADGPGSAVVELKVGSRRLDAATLAHLRAFKHLRRLDIDCLGSLSEPGLAVLAELPELQHLDLSMVEVTDAMLARLEGLTGLRVLLCYGKKISDDGLAHLSKLTRLERLSIPYSQVGDGGLAHLAGLTELRELYLSHSRVSDRGLAHLRRLTKLRRLGLWAAQVRGPGLEHLAGMDDLEELDLRGSKITADGLQHLPAAKRLRWVDVRQTEVGPRGLAECPGGRLRLEIDGSTARLRNTASGDAVGPPLRHRPPDRDGEKIVCRAFSPDGKLLATATGYRSGQGKEKESMGEIRVWEVASGKLLAHRERGLGYVRGLQFLKDSKTLVFDAELFLVDGP